VPEAEFLHEGTIDILRVGNAYRIPYAAAFRCRSRELVPRLRAPTFFLAYPDDSLTANLKLLGELPPACRIQPMPVDRLAGAQREIEILRAHAHTLEVRQLGSNQRGESSSRAGNLRQTAHDHPRWTSSRGGSTVVRQGIGGMKFLYPP